LKPLLKKPPLKLRLKLLLKRPKKRLKAKPFGFPVSAGMQNGKQRPTPGAAFLLFGAWN
jgi:hypothetical protein